MSSTGDRGHGGLEVAGAVQIPLWLGVVASTLLMVLLSLSAMPSRVMEVGPVPLLTHQPMVVLLTILLWVIFAPIPIFIRRVNIFDIDGKDFNQAIFAIELDGPSWDFGPLAFSNVVIVSISGLWQGYYVCSFL
jgi:hypothetical protein